MKITKQTLILLAILVLSFVLRFYQLSTVPPHLTPDEASLGYNAYSILKTGRDEYGQLLPIIFKSFGDYKPGLYVYTTIPFVALFGLNEFSVRATSAISGVIAVILLYLITKKLFPDKEHRNLPYITSFLLSVAPWHIMFSRGAWEINLSLTLTLLGTYFFLKIPDNIRNLYYSVLAFALTFSAYQGAKLSTGIVVLLLIVTHFETVRRIPVKRYFSAGLIALLVSLPILMSLFNGKAGRLAVFSVFSYPRSESYIAHFIAESGISKNTLPYYLYYSETQNFARGVLGRWFNHFSGRFLFFEGDWQNPRHTAPNHGVLNLADMVLLPIGVFVLIKNSRSKNVIFVILWLLTACLPAVLSRDQVHAVRSYNMVIPVVITLGLGIQFLLNSFRGVSKNVVILTTVMVYLVGFIYFLDAFFVHVPSHASKLWEYGYKQIVETVSPLENDYDNIYVQQSYAQPYIFFLFFNKVDPATYQKQAKLAESTSGDVGHIEKVGKISFIDIDWSRVRGEKGSIIVGDTLHIPVTDSKEGKEFHIIKEIPYLDGKNIAFRIIAINK